MQNFYPTRYVYLEQKYTVLDSMVVLEEILLSVRQRASIIIHDIHNYIALGKVVPSPSRPQDGAATRNKNILVIKQ